MRLGRVALAALALLAGFAAWPQGPSLPPVDHSQHPLVEVPDGRPVPYMRVRVFPDRMDGFNVFLETRDFLFTPQDAGAEAVPNQGHAHLYINGQKIARMYAPWHHLPAASLRKGINRLEVEFSSNDHSVWSVAGQPVGADVLIDTEDTDGDPIIREEVRYTLDWDWGDARRAATGGWIVETDRGYVVHVESGRLVTRNLELIPCHGVPPPQTAWMKWLGPSPASAGHSSLAPNESKISESYEEDFGAPARRFIERRTVTDPEYCRAHYLVARPSGTAPGATALEVRGTWVAPDGPGTTEFRIRSAAAFGQFVDLTSESGERKARLSIVGGIGLTVRRPLGALFDGIDFANPDADDLGTAIMRRLVTGTRMVVTSG